MTSVRIQRVCAWCGPALIILFVIGFIALAGLIPPAAPDHSPEEVVSYYSDDKTAMRLGILIAMIGWTLIGPWGISIANLIRGRSKGSRAMTMLQVAAAGAGMCDVVLTLLIYGVIAFRPDTMSPDTVRMLNDLAWFLFLFSYPPFSIWMIAIGAAILADDSDGPAYPRWSGFLNFWAAFLIVPAGLIIFFKDGPFAFDGVFALYMPLVVFFIWISTMTWLTLQAIKREETEAVVGLDASSPGVAADHARSTTAGG